jgi:hypothetical protein
MNKLHEIIFEHILENPGISLSHLFEDILIPNPKFTKKELQKILLSDIKMEFIQITRERTLFINEEIL